jgi:hypothetical protein
MEPRFQASSTIAWSPARVLQESDRPIIHYREKTRLIPPNEFGSRYCCITWRERRAGGLFGT